MAAASWVRSLSCNSSAVADDVYRPPPPPTTTRKRPLLSCGSTNDVKVKASAAALLPATKDRRPPRRQRNRPSRPPQLKPPPSHQAPAPARPAFLAMTELPEGHYSRRVVELIFAAGWNAPPAAEVEALFRVHSAPRAVSNFEAARAAARARGAGAANTPRCAADGNEVMRFQCRAAEADGDVICAAVATCSFGPAKSSAVRTFAGSGAAHAGAGDGAGRRAMLVCRVIAGRVRAAGMSASDDATGYDSVDMGGGELVVLDSRAVLPCFLVIYRVKDCCCTTE